MWKEIGQVCSCTVISRMTFSIKNADQIGCFSLIAHMNEKKEERGVVGSIDFSNIIGRITGHSQTIRISKSLRICRHCF